ncbi:MAG: proteinase inhibitor I78 [Acidovorax sp.]|nr:MAG: proteinase inhibitor I78 [Acidovorax sp.]
MSRPIHIVSTSLILAAAALGGCSNYGTAPAASSGAAGTPSASAPPTPPATGQCTAQPAQGAVGQNSTSTVVETARARSGAQIARILRPGQMITKEFNAQRLNLEVDATGRIVAVNCG